MKRKFIRQNLELSSNSVGDVAVRCRTDENHSVTVLAGGVYRTRLLISGLVMDVSPASIVRLIYNLMTAAVTVDTGHNGERLSTNSLLFRQHHHMSIR